MNNRREVLKAVFLMASRLVPESQVFVNNDTWPLRKAVPYLGPENGQLWMVLLDGDTPDEAVPSCRLKIVTNEACAVDHAMCREGMTLFEIEAVLQPAAPGGDPTEREESLLLKMTSRPGCRFDLNDSRSVCILQLAISIHQMVMGLEPESKQVKLELAPAK